MKKLNKLFIILCAVMVSCVTFYACAIGQVVTTYYDKQGNAITTEIYGIQQTVTNMPQAPQIFGYNFIGWGNNKDSETVVLKPYVAQDLSLYAKYVIMDGWFNAHDHNRGFYGEDLYWRVEPISRQTHEILIEDATTTHDFSHIAIIGEAGGSFVLKSVRVMDQYANEIEDGNSALNIWEPKTSFPANNEGKYVVAIEVISSGAFYVDVR
jgi:hypothetical protein